MPTVASSQDEFTVDDAIDLVRVSDPRISPDGTLVAFVRTELDWDENERNDRIWVVREDGSDARPFTSAKGDASPRWSPDGRWLAFLRSVGEEAETRQIHLLRADGGEAIPLTRHPTSIRSFEWAHDSRSLFFLAADSLTEEEDEAREKGDDAIFVDEGPNGQTRGEWNGIWHVPADPDSGATRRVSPESIRIGDFAVSPDGDRLAFTARTENRRNDEFRAEIHLLDLATGEATRLTRNEAPESRLAWSPDGRFLTFVAPDLERWELDQGNLYALDLERGEVRSLAQDFEGDIRSYAWHPDGERLDLAALVRTDAHLFRLDIASGRTEQLTDLPGVASAPSYSESHDRVAFLHGDPANPGDVFVGSLPGPDPVRVTRANPWLSDRRLAEPEIVRWASADGLEVEGLLYRPAEGPDSAADERALVLEIHGGPAGVFTRSFDADAQVLTAQGYAVLQPNVRGSSGYGDALLRGNMEDIGGGDYEDLMTGVEAMLDRGVAHTDSLVLKGWSYGGILGGWTITRTDRFRAASLGAMVADWRSEFGAGFHFDVTRWYLGGDPWSNREVWLERSAYTHLDRVRTPTILFHGERDRTDTMEQSMNFFAGLRHLGVEARFVLFPREGHGIEEPRHHRTRLVEELRWFERQLRGVEWEPPERPTEEAGPVKEVAPGGLGRLQ